ncbi:MAG: ATP-binding protein [Flavobacteriales bacterium]|nr:ATP-binding protein [Flavobacteriales bacterium]MEB2340433.1 ATP-binding protein [Flavobacteriia bacterium]
MIPRTLLPKLHQRLKGKKAIVLLGARQTGKTTLINELTRDLPDVVRFNGDDPLAQRSLTDVGAEELARLIGKAKVVVIDEAQRIDGVGLAAKMMIDQLHRKVILSGSSALELNARIQEPLTGRKWTYRLHPVSWAEIREYQGLMAARGRLGEMLVTGLYPEVLTAGDDRERVLRELADSYLFKDILALTGIRKPRALVDLLRALAWQVGQEVSMSEVARTVGIDMKTAEQYVQYLEQGYIVFRLGPFSRNLRTELRSKQKVYFWDNGIRNAVIGDLSPAAQRQDMGALWENFVVGELHKRNDYLGAGSRLYYWRTAQQQEIDLVEERNGKLQAMEIKWSPKAKAKPPLTFTKAYPGSTFDVITPATFERFLE